MRRASQLVEQVFEIERPGVKIIPERGGRLAARPVRLLNLARCLLQSPIVFRAGLVKPALSQQRQRQIGSDADNRWIEAEHMLIDFDGIVVTPQHVIGPTEIPSNIHIITAIGLRRDVIGGVLFVLAEAVIGIAAPVVGIRVIRSGGDRLIELPDRFFIAGLPGQADSLSVRVDRLIVVDRPYRESVTANSVSWTTNAVAIPSQALPSAAAAAKCSPALVASTKYRSASYLAGSGHKVWGSK